MARRRGSGEGSIYRRDSDGMWVAAVELPRGVDGKRRRKVIVRKDKASVVRAMREAQADLERQGDLPTSSPTVEQWLTHWLANVSAKRVRPKTQYEREGDVRRYILPAIGSKRLDKLTPEHVTAMHRYITDELGRSSTTALRCHRLLSVALRDAKRAGRVTRNVATSEYVDAPRAAVPASRALTLDDAVRLLDLAVQDTYRVRWTLGLLTGARTGEVLGLEWDRVDFDADTITLSWQLQRLPYVHGCGDTCGRKRAGSCPERRFETPAGFELRQVRGGLHLVRPKTRSGWRVVPLVEPLRSAMLSAWEAAGRPDTGLVFTGADGGPLTPEDDFQAWKSLRERAGLSARRHDARHTAATLLLALGVDPRVIQSILGHSSAVTTALYQHVDQTMQRDALTRLSERLALPTR